MLALNVVGELMALSVVLVACRQYVIPFFFFSSLPFQKYVLGLHKLGGNMVKFAFLFEVGHDFFLSKWVRWLHEFGK